MGCQTDSASLITILNTWCLSVKYEEFLELGVFAKFDNVQVYMPDSEAEKVNEIILIFIDKDATIFVPLCQSEIDSLMLLFLFLFIFSSCYYFT